MLPPLSNNNDIQKTANRLENLSRPSDILDRLHSAPSGERVLGKPQYLRSNCDIPSPLLGGLNGSTAKECASSRDGELYVAPIHRACLEVLRQLRGIVYKAEIRVIAGIRDCFYVNSVEYLASIIIVLASLLSPYIVTLPPISRANAVAQMSRQYHNSR
jgi:hypothetical protein